MFTFLNRCATDLITIAADARSTSDTLRVQAVLAALTGSETVRHALGAEIAKGGLTVPGFNLLAYIRTCEQGTVRRSEIGQRAALSPAQLDVTLTRLEHSGLLARRRDTDDRRVVWLSLTPDGSRCVAKVLSRCVAGIATISAALDERQLRGLIAAHRQMHAGIARLVSSAPEPEVLRPNLPTFPN